MVDCEKNNKLSCSPKEIRLEKSNWYSGETNQIFKITYKNNLVRFLMFIDNELRVYDKYGILIEKIEEISYEKSIEKYGIVNILIKYLSRSGLTGNVLILFDSEIIKYIEYYNPIRIFNNVFSKFLTYDEKYKLVFYYRESYDKIFIVEDVNKQIILKPTIIINNDNKLEISCCELIKISEDLYYRRYKEPNKVIAIHLGNSIWITLYGKCYYFKDCNDYYIQAEKLIKVLYSLG